MKRRILILISLLLALGLAGCAGASMGQTDKEPGKPVEKSTANQTKDNGTDPEKATAAEAGQPVRRISFMQALAISPDEYLDADGAFGFETIRYRSTAWNRETDLFFTDKAYRLEYTGDLATEQGNWSVLRHTNGQYWNTLDHIGQQPAVPDGKNLFAVADTEDLLKQNPIFSPDLRSSLLISLEDYNPYIKDEPEMVDLNGIPCWRYTVSEESIPEYSGKDIPAGSVERSLIYFRQDNCHFVYAQTDIITPDGTVIPKTVIRTMSGKEAWDFYRKKADLFADVDVRDRHGDHTLTVIIDPGEAEEITYFCPMNGGEKMMTYFSGRKLYMDRAGTVSAAILDIADSGMDRTVYAIKDSSAGKNTEPLPTEPAIDPDSVNIMDYWGHFTDLCKKAGITGTAKDPDTFTADPIVSRKVTLSTRREGKCLCIEVGVDMVEADGARVDSLRSDFEPKLLANGWELMGEIPGTGASPYWDLNLIYEKQNGDDWYQMRILCYMTDKGPAIWTITIYDHAEALRG